MGFRHGDNAAIAVIELVDRDVEARGKEDLARHEATKAATGGSGGLRLNFRFRLFPDNIARMKENAPAGSTGALGRHIREIRRGTRA